MPRPSYEELEQKVIELESEKKRHEQIEHELFESQERYRLHFTLTNEVIYSLDTDFRVLSVSPNVERILGYKPEELIGRPFHALNVLAEEYVKQAFSDVQEVLSTKKVESTLYQFVTKDGRRMFGEVSGVPLVRDGKAVAVISVARDVTERLKMEHSLRESDERFRAIFDSAQDCIFLKDITLRYTFVNPCMKKLFDLSSEDIIGKMDKDLFGDEAMVNTQEVERKVLSGEIVEVEHSMLVGGKQLTFHVIEVPILDSQGRVSGLCGIARNITERKRFEEALQDKEKQLGMQAKNLEEVNTALKVLLNHREEEKKKAQEDIVSKTRKLIFPYLEKLGKTVMNDEGRVYLDIIRTNLAELISPYMSGHPREYNHLTPTEIQIVDLIKQGKTTKEIATISNVSPPAISFHRANIRKKLGLVYVKTNLRSYLQSMDHS